MNKIKGINKMLTIKESMILRKCINNYVLENNLEYDKSPLFSDLIHKLKDFEESPSDLLEQGFTSAYIKEKENVRKSLNKELKKYSFQTITNKKVIELIKEERLQENAIKESLVIETNKKGN